MGCLWATSGLYWKTNVLFFFLYRSDSAYYCYVDLLEDDLHAQEEEDLQRCIQESLEDTQTTISHIEYED